MQNALHENDQWVALKPVFTVATLLYRTYNTFVAKFPRVNRAARAFLRSEPF
jgi:hypothetical protein